MVINLMRSWTTCLLFWFSWAEGLWNHDELILCSIHLSILGWMRGCCALPYLGVSWSWLTTCLLFWFRELMDSETMMSWCYVVFIVYFTYGLDDKPSVFQCISQIPSACGVVLQVPPPYQCWDSSAILIIRRMYYEMEFSYIKLISLYLPEWLI